MQQTASSFLRAREETARRLRERAQTYCKGGSARPIDKLITILGLMSFEQVSRVLREQGPSDDYAVREVHGIGKLWPDRDAELPAVLGSGVVSTSSLGEPARTVQLATLAAMRQVAAAHLDGVLTSARAWADSNREEARRRVQREKLTMERAYAEAEGYWEALQRGEASRARAGLERLRSMAPDDAYLRLLLAESLRMEGRFVEALGECLYSRWLLAAQPDTKLYFQASLELLRELVALGLGVVAVDLARELRAQSTYVTGLDDERAWCGVYERIAWLQMGAMISLFIGLTPDDVAPGQTRIERNELFVKREGDPSFGPMTHEWLRGAWEGPGGDGREPPRVFISYRRADVPAAAKKLHGALTTMLGADVFFDEHGLRGGSPWKDQLAKAIDRADWMVVLVGPAWPLDRLTQPGDIVRREIARALDKKPRVLPVLVDGAPFPDAGKLPQNVRAMADVQCVSWTSSETPWSIVEVLRSARPAPTLDEVTEAPKAKQARRLRETLPRVVLRQTSGHEGISWSGFHLPGRWEVKMTDPGGAKRLVELDLLDEEASPFRGTVRELSGAASPPTTSLEGRYALIYDAEAECVLGIHLHGMRGGFDEFVQEIPMHEIVGDGYLGRDSTGATFFSKCVEPQHL